MWLARSIGKRQELDVFELGGDYAETARRPKMGNRVHSPTDEQRMREAALDETLAGTFPASDPLSSIPNPEQDDAAIETTMPSVDRPLDELPPRAP